MKDEEINRKIEQSSKDDQYYTDMKIRAVKNTIEEVRDEGKDGDNEIRKELSLFFWMRKNPKQAVIGFIIFVSLCMGVSSYFDLGKFIAKKFGIELKK